MPALPVPIISFALCDASSINLALGTYGLSELHGTKEQTEMATGLNWFCPEESAEIKY